MRAAVPDPGRLDYDTGGGHPGWLPGGLAHPAHISCGESFATATGAAPLPERRPSRDYKDLEAIIPVREAGQASVLLTSATPVATISRVPAP